MPSSSASSKPSLAASIASWRDGSQGFFKFLADVQPCVRGPKGLPVQFEIEDWQRDDIRRILDDPQITVACLCYPRRHGKTLLTALLIVWRFLSRPAETIAVVANSEKQSIDVCFRAIRGIITDTPMLKSLVAAGTIVVNADKIEIPSARSTVQAFSANPSALFGKALTAAQMSEIHAAKNGGDDVFMVLAGSLLDTEGSMLFLDSTTSPKSSKLYELYQNATHETDPDRSIAFIHRQYTDIDDACARSPKWLPPAKVRSLARQMLPADFGRQHLNRWQDAASTLFPADMLAACVHEYALDVKALAAGSAYIVGGGLDRAFGGSKHGDRTVTACVVKLSLNDEDHVFVLDAESVFLGRLGGIKSRFEGYHRNFEMKRATLESYGAQDVADYMATQPYSSGVEVIHPSRKTKYQAFMGLYQAAAEQRLHIHPRFKDLLGELAVFEVHADGKVTDGEAAVPKFTHPRGAHDDQVHAVAWAVHSLRHVVINPYEIEGIHCTGRGPSVVHCALNGGGTIPPCADACRSMSEVRRMYEAYKQRVSVAPVELPAFIEGKLKNVGSHTLPK